MKTTDFLKKFSLIDSKFIDDFYSFYDEGKNEYDQTINLETIAQWLNVRKDHLKRLLKVNFDDNIDFSETKMKKNENGSNSNNKKHILLTYECAKLLCMISKSEKADVIRKYYIDLEKLLIKHKDDIANSLYQQLEINANNKKIIDKNDKKALIYILKVENDTNDGFKIGRSEDLKARMKQYNVGRISELPIVFVYQTDKLEEIEDCMRDNLKRYQLKHNTETFDIDLDFIKDTIKYCAKTSILLKKNNKLFKAKDNKKWIIIIDKENLDVESELYKKISTYTKKINKKLSKKTTKKTSKKTTKKPSKKTNKKLSKKTKKND